MCAGTRSSGRAGSVCPTSLKTTYDNKVVTEGQAAATAWLRQAVINHIADEASTLTGKLVEWDVINEPYANHELQDILGNSAMIDWFRQAKQSDPAARMFINDYGILSSRGADYSHQDHYFNTIQYLLAGGAPVEGIGMQSHFGSGLTGMERMLEILDRFATFGVPIAATEFDVNVTDEQVQADFLRDFMTTLFSHSERQRNHHVGLLAELALAAAGRAVSIRLDDQTERASVDRSGARPVEHRGDRNHARRWQVHNERVSRRVRDQGYLRRADDDGAMAELAAGGSSVNVNLPATLSWRAAKRDRDRLEPERGARSLGSGRWRGRWLSVERQLPGMPWAEVASVPAATLSFTEGNLCGRHVVSVSGAPRHGRRDVGIQRPGCSPHSARDDRGNHRQRLDPCSHERRSAVSGSVCECPLGCAPTFRYRIDLVPPLAIHTGDGDDTLVVSYHVGAPTILQIDHQAGSGFNSVTVLGGDVSMEAVASTDGLLSTSVQNGAHLTTNRFNQGSLVLAGAGTKATVRPEERSRTCSGRSTLSKTPNWI